MKRLEGLGILIRMTLDAGVSQLVLVVRETSLLVTLSVPLPLG